MPGVLSVMIAAGGTGGHLFPAEALGHALRARGHRVALMTDARTATRARDRFETVHVVASAGMVGRGIAGRATGALSLARGTLQARAMLRAARPDAIIGFGGYPSVPPIIAARMMRRRPAILIHDQNAVLGAANRFLAGLSDAIATSFPRVDGVPPGTRTVAVGNPVRDAIAAIGPYLPPSNDMMELVVLGGSLGARVFSDVVPDAVMALAAAYPGRRVRIAQQARPEDVDRVARAYAKANIDAAVSPFFPDVAALLARAHLVIARAGGSTVAELASARRPSILVPLPIAAGDEQGANAAFLVDAGAAWSVRQTAFTTDWLAARLIALFARADALVVASRAAIPLAYPNAAENLAVLVEELGRGRYDAKRPIRTRDVHDGEGVGA